MRNVAKTTTLESKFPLLAVENNCILSKDADITSTQTAPIYPLLFCVLLAANRMNSHFRAVRSWNKVGSTQQIQKMLFVHPFSSNHHFIPHHGNMCCWPSKPYNT